MNMTPLPVNTIIVATLTVVAIFFGAQYIDIEGKPYLSTTLKVTLIAVGVLTVTWAARRDGFRAGIRSEECASTRTTQNTANREPWQVANARAARQLQRR